MLGIVATGWALLAGAFLRRPRSAHAPRAAQRDSGSRIGILVSVAGFAVVWGIRRSPTHPPLGLPVPLQWIAVVFTAGLVTVAAWLLWGAFRALGEQWSAGARVLIGHRLVAMGPYARVRHPIYAGLGALLIATGLALSQTNALLGGALLYGIGTAVRIRREEALLYGTLGDEYAEYARRVPAVVPRLRRRAG